VSRVPSALAFHTRAGCAASSAASHHPRSSSLPASEHFQATSATTQEMTTASRPGVNDQRSMNGKMDDYLATTSAEAADN